MAMARPAVLFNRPAGKMNKNTICGGRRDGEGTAEVREMNGMEWKEGGEG
jgi:hypothetical protein